MQMDGKNLSKDSSTAFHAALKFMYWQKFCWDTTNLPIGFVCSTMMEKGLSYQCSCIIHLSVWTLKDIIHSLLI